MHGTGHLRNIIGSQPPQRGKLAEIAIGEIESGLAKLASLGFPHKVVPADQTSGPEFPKMLYNPNNESRIVETPEEESDARSDGWDDLPALKDLRAQQAEDEKNQHDKDGDTGKSTTGGGGGTVKKVEPAGGTGAVKAAGPKGAAINPGNS